MQNNSLARAQIDSYTWKQLALEKSCDIGIDPTNAMERDDWRTIVSTLGARRQIEEICSVPAEEFSPDLEARLDREVNQFLEASSQLETFSALTQEVERLKEMVGQKNKSSTQYKM